MNKNIELIRYKRYADDILLLEQVVSGYVDTQEKSGKRNQKTQGTTRRTAQKTYGELFNQADDDLKKLCLTVTDFIKNLGDDIQEKQLKLYVAFKRLKNFVCLEIKPQARSKCLLLFLKINPKKVDLNNDLLRDVSNIGHYGTGDLEARIQNMEEFEQIKHLIVKSYEAN